MSLQVKTMADWMAEGKEAEILFWVGSAAEMLLSVREMSSCFRCRL